ncbi:MAG: DUF3945 domain-containing protein [Flavobacteriaceae bacterium]|nr:DUF3945 domain-containing protein [Flavobacteriaceae bacterium]
MSDTTQGMPEQFTDILLVLDQKENEIRAVKGLDKKGNLETTDPKENNPDFMKVDKHGDILSNFFSNYLRQAKEPTRFKFFQVPKKQVEQIAMVIKENLKNPTQALTDMLKKHEVEPKNYELKTEEKMETTQEQTQDTQQVENQKEQSNEPKYKVEDIDWNTLGAMNITKEKLEKYKVLDDLLKGYKTNKLIPVSFNVGSAFSRLDARLSLQKNEDGKVIMAIHGIRKEPNLSFEFFGHQFSDEDKKNLKETGNMGRVVELENTKTGEKIPSIISIDKLTNELVALKSEYIKIPDEVSGVKLSEEQKQDLQEGKAIEVKGMVSKKGEPFDAKLQFNADKRYVEFLFPENQKQSKNQSLPLENGEIPKEFRGKELSDKDRATLEKGSTLYVTGLVSKNGKEYNGYLKLNKEKTGIDFSFKNPDKLKLDNKKEEQKPEDTTKSKGRKM